MAGLAAYALFQQRSAVAGRLAVESRFEVDKHYDLSLLLANEAVQVRDTLETRSALLSAVLRQPQPAAQLRFHSERVYGLAFSPDGRTLATGAGDGVVALWDLASRQRSSIPPLDVGGEVTSVAFNREGTLIAVGNRRKNTSGSLNAGGISYWDVATGKRRPEVSESDDNAWALRFTQDGRLLAADGDGRATLWRVGQREPEWASTRVNELAGYDVALDTRGKWMAVGSEDSELSLLSFSDRNKALILPKVHRGSVQGIAFSPVEETLASVDSNGTVVLWNLATRMPRDDDSADAGVQGVTRIAYTPDGKRLAIGTSDGTVLMWDIDTREPRELVVTGHGDAVMSVAFNADGTLLAVGLKSGLVLLGDLRGGEQLVRQQNLPGGAWDVATAADGRALVATEDGLHEVRLNPSAASAARQLAPGFFWRVALARDDSTFAAARTCREARDPLIEVVVSDTRDSRRPPQVISRCELENYTLSLSRDGTMLAIGRLDGTIDLRFRSDRWAPRSVLGTRATLREAVDASAFSPDGALLAVGRRTGSIELWKTADRTLARSWKADPNGISTLAFTADGMLLASGADRSVRLWNVALAGAVGALQTVRSVDAVAFSPDGRLLGVVAGDDGVALWDVSTLQAFGEALKADRGVNRIGSMRALTFTSDGRFLVTVGTDSQLFRWDLRVETMLRHTCYGANRTFTPGEWALFGSWWGRRSCQ
jgi:WD40 repeat protein